jgi:hypothetical protein
VLPAHGGPPPAPTREEWQALGAAAAFYPALTSNAALQTTWDLLHDFKARGTVALVEAQERARTSPWGVADRVALVDSARIQELESAFLPQELQRDYEGTFGYRERPRG